MRTTVQNTSRDARPSELDGALAAQAAGVGVWRWSPASGRLVLAGIAGALLRAEDVVNRRAFLARVHPDVRDLVDQALGHAARHGPLAIDFRLSPDVGAERWLRMRGQGGLDDREPTEMVGVLTDISEWKDAERSYGGLAALAASSDDAIVAKTPEGIITDWNRGAELIFGYAAAEMIGKPINLLLPPVAKTRKAVFSSVSNADESAVAFLERLQDAPRGCVVSDIRMPGIDGLQLQQRLNKLGVDLPMILMTGHGDVRLAVEAMRAGAIDFIEKPFDDEVLLSAIRLAFDRSEKLGQKQAEAAAIRARLASLSGREREVLEGLVAGHPNKTIARTLNISPRTVEIYRANVMLKTAAGSLSDLVRIALIAAAAASD